MGQAKDGAGARWRQSGKGPETKGQQLPVRDQVLADMPLQNLVLDILTAL
jgi:hypothetical protein